MVAVSGRTLVTVLLLSWLPSLKAQEATVAEGSPAILVDRIVALVDETPVFESDLTAAAALEPIATPETQNEQQYRRRLLDQLIDERLRYAAVRRHGFEELDLEKIDQQVEILAERFGGSESLTKALQEAAMDQRLLREMVARQLAVWDFVENRLGARVLVDLDEIEAYYRGEFSDHLGSLGEPIPPLREVREKIRELLYQRQLTEEVDRWTAELRFQADISDYLNRGESTPPA